jgi:hypothetical protein
MKGISTEVDREGLSVVVHRERVERSANAVTDNFCFTVEHHLGIMHRICSYVYDRMFSAVQCNRVPALISRHMSIPEQ